MSVSQLDGIQKDLEQKKADLLERIDAAEGRNGRAVGGNPSRSDLSTDYASKDRNTALLSIDRKTLIQVEEALERIENGTYGQCESCGDMIPIERLEFLPYATLCVACQQKQNV